MQEEPAQKFPKGFIRPAGFDDLPAPIRKRERKELASLSSDMDSQEEDVTFVDNMIEEARQKRKSHNRQHVKASPDLPKKQKKKTKTEVPVEE